MASAGFTVGHDVGAVGKWLRLVLGSVALLWAVGRLAQTGLLIGGAAWFVGIGLAYLAAHRLLGRRVLSKMNPWVGTLLLVGPAILIPSVQTFPLELRLGMVAYFSASLVLNAAMNYGGCEVLALPSLLSRRWYTVYCPLNVIDLVEKGVAGEARARAPETPSS